MSDLHDIAINGSGSSGGGTFNKVTIRGEGTITENVTCTTFKTFGTSEIKESLEADQFSVFGESKVKGSCTAPNLKVMGQLTVEGDVTSKNTKVRGSLEIGNDFKGDVADVKGELTVKGGAELERLSLTGRLQVSGMLNAGDIDLQLKYDDSHVDEIGGEKIQIRRKTAPLPFGKSEGMFQAKVIEGDDLYLEYTKADVVRGKRVSIGKGCEINLVEFSQTLKKSGNPVVKEAKKI
jgi:cytoskeletal protein CcmA (bactofilin family)